jgi:hypothetical protein
MKKIAFLSLVVMFVLASCSKSNKLNRSLDGTWNVVKINENPLPTGFSYSLKFTKEKNGKGAFTFTSSVSPSQTGTYSLIDDTKIVLTYSAEDIDTVTVVSYSKTDLKINDGEQNWELTKQ